MILKFTTVLWTKFKKQVFKQVIVVLVFQFSFFSTISAQNRDVDSLKNCLYSAKHDTERCKILDQLIEIAPEQEWQSYNEQMKELAVKNLAVKLTVRQIKLFSKYYATALHNQGIVFFERSNDEKAIEYFNKSIDVAKKAGNTNQIAISLQSISQINIKKGNNTLALNQLYICLKIFEDEKDEIGIADVYLSLGDISYFQKDFKKALEYHVKSYNLYVKNNYDVAISSICYKVGLDYYELKDYPKSLLYQQKSIDIIEGSDLPANSVAYLNIAQIYILQIKYAKALVYALKGLKISETMQNKVGVSQSHIVLCRLQELEKNFKEAAVHGERALLIAKQIAHPTEISLAARELSTIYTALKQPKKARSMQELYVNTRNTIENQESKNALLEQKLKYEYEKKELLAQAHTEKALDNLTSRNDRSNLMKNIWLIVFASVIILVGLSAWFLYRNLKQKSIITLQKNNLLKQKLLVSQMNPHFIFNSLNAIQNYIFKQDSLKAANYLAQFSDLIRMILDYSRKDYISIDSEIKLLNIYLDLQKLRFENKFDYVIFVDPNIETEFTHIPPMLAQPFIENALEHGIFYKKEKGKVEIKLFFDGENLIYEIDDNGVGMEDALKLKQKLKTPYQSLATIITKERMNIISDHNGNKNEIEITDKKNESNESSGVKVKFAVPFKLI